MRLTKRLLRSCKVLLTQLSRPKVSVLFPHLAAPYSESSFCKISVNPESRLKYYWDILITITFFYYIFVLPYRYQHLSIRISHSCTRVAFQYYGKEWFYVDGAIDLLYFVDMLLRFVTGIEVNGARVAKQWVNGEVVYDKGFLARKYIRCRLVQPVESDITQVDICSGSHLHCPFLSYSRRSGRCKASETTTHQYTVRCS